MNIDIVALAVAFGGIITAFAAYKKNQDSGTTARLNQVQRTYAGAIEDLKESVIAPLKADMAELRKSNCELKVRVSELEREIKALRDENDSLKDFRSLFGMALQYIRELCHYIDLPKGEKKGMTKPKMRAELKAHFKEIK